MDHYGGFWRRVGAYLIDAILLSIVSGIVGGIFGFGFGITGALMGTPDEVINDGAEAMGGLIGLILGIAYFAGLESSSWQGTVGKKALGMVVTDLQGQRISFGRAFGRYLAKILSALILFIGYIMIAFTERKQGLHDILAGTLVYVGNPVERDVAAFE